MLERFPELIKLSPDEKCLLIQELTDDLADIVENTPIPPEVMEELDRRHANYLKNPNSGSSWEEVEARIRSRHAFKTDDPA